MKKISFLFLTAAMAFSVAGGFVSCKDYEEDLRADQRVTKTVLDALKESVEGAGGVLEDITALQDSLDETKTRLEEVIADAENHATKDALREAIAELADIYATQEALNVVDSTLRAEIEKAKEALEGEIDVQAQNLLILEGRVTTAEATLGKLDSWFSAHQNLPDSVKTAYEKAAEAWTKAVENATAIGTLEQKDADLKATQDSLLACYNEAIDSINTNFNALDTFVKDLVGEGFTGTLAELQQTTTERLDAQQERLDSIVGAIAVINEEIEALNAKYDTLEQYLSHLISGVLVQSVSNPIYGSFAFPTNFSSNLLAAYYGDFSSSVEFPTAREGYYVEGSTILGVEDLNKLGVSSKTYGVGRVVNEAKNNAGTVYMTINPTNIDFTGETLELVNSLDEASGVVLDTLIKSDKKLTFGWTRGANNGFYEAGARIAAENIDNVKVRVNLSDMKDALKDVLTPGDGINVTNVVSTVANSFTDWLDANALKASWTVNGEEMAVYSEYKIAATAIKPVGYGFMQDMNVQDFPGFGTAENLLNKVFNRVKFEVEDLIPTFDIEKYKFTELKGIELKGDSVIAKTTVSFEINIAEDEIFEGVEKWFYFYIDDDNDPTTAAKKDSVWVEIDGNKQYDKPFTEPVEVEVDITDMIKDIEGDINTFVTSINNDLKEINNLLDELNKVNEVSNKLTNAADRVQSALVKGLDKLNNGLCKVINSANKALQPVMLVETTDGFARLSGVQKSPSVVSGTEITLFPTSYTAEILAPAFKKLVGVTNVYTTNYAQNEECEAELQRVNAQENVAEVLDDAKAGIPVTLKQGYVYEVAYTAVDYTGMVVARKYYVTVK